MPDLPLHPAIVHLPLGLAFAVPLVAIGVTVAYWRGRLPRAAFAVVFALQVVVAASGGAAMLAGQREEHRVERVVGKRAIEAHEERAEAFVWTAAAVAAAGLALLVVPARAVGALSAVVIAGTLAVGVLGAVTGEAGGEIVYRHGGAAAYVTTGADGRPVPVPASGEKDDDD